MEPKIPAPRVVYPDKDRLMAVAKSEPISWRVWASWGSAAAVVGGVLALLTPTVETEPRAKMTAQAPQVTQVDPVKIDTVETPAVVDIKPKKPPVILRKKTPQPTLEVPSVEPPDSMRKKWQVINLRPAPVQIAHTQPTPQKIEPIETKTAPQSEPEPTLLDVLLEPFRKERQLPNHKQLVASFNNPFKTQEKDERY